MGGLYKVDLETRNASLEPGKVSEMILEFAAPLLQLDPVAPHDITMLGEVLLMAEMCWNLPGERFRDGAH